jgi:hypothetical protein
VAAAGIATLQAAGIEVSMMDGAENRRALDINKDFLARMEEEGGLLALHFVESACGLQGGSGGPPNLC